MATTYTADNSPGVNDYTREQMNEAHDDIVREWSNNVAVNKGREPTAAELAGLGTRLEAAIRAATRPNMTARQIMGAVRHNFEMEG